MKDNPSDKAYTTSLTVGELLIAEWEYEDFPVTNVQLVFDRLVTNDFNTAAFSDVKVVALAVWHEGFLPEVSHLPKEAKKSAGYVVDKLMRFNCVSLKAKELLRNLVSKLRDAVTYTPVSARGCDKLALQWGLDKDLKLQVRELLEFQTRHYSHQA